MIFEVLVQLKGEVLDPEARAIRETLTSQGIKGIKDLSIAKRYQLDLDVAGEGEGVDKATKIASTYLANPVSETFAVKRVTP